MPNYDAYRGAFDECQCCGDDDPGPLNDVGYCERCVREIEEDEARYKDESEFKLRLSVWDVVRRFL